MVTDMPSDMLVTAQKYIEENALNREELQWYPEYHMAAPVGWINDPNGFCYFKGNYHLFYQHYPYAPKWGPMHWGHKYSSDLIHWKDAPVALAPDEYYDGDGCFSGCGLVKDDKMYLMYTGHKDLARDRDERIETQFLAASEDGFNFTKCSKDPVLYAPGDEEIVHNGHFRDPKVWEHDGKYYVVIGAQDTKETGHVVIYESDDLMDWKYKNIMAKARGNEGFMWECPNFAEIDGSEVLIFSPQGVKPEGYKFNNLHQSVYMIGNMNYETGEFSRGDIHQLDYGTDFYAPQIMQDKDGRCLMIGWLDMWETDMVEAQEKWAGMMTIPRELHMKNGAVISQPVAEMVNLRGNEVSYENVSVAEEISLEGIKGITGELVATADLSNAGKFKVALRAGKNEETVLTYDKNTSMFSVDRTKAGQGPADVRTVPVDLHNNKLNLRIFIDKSSIEVFVNDGELVMSHRIYPAKDSDGIKFSAEDGTVLLDKAAFYELNN